MPVGQSAAVRMQYSIARAAMELYGNWRNGSFRVGAAGAACDVKAGRTATISSDHRPGLLQLLGGVHRQRGSLHREGGNGETRLNQPQLLEPLQILQG